MRIGRLDRTKKIGRINRDNTDPRYWEEILRRYKLEQKEENEDGENDFELPLGEAEESEGKLWLERERGRGQSEYEYDISELRDQIDPDDPFMVLPNILKIRTREREIPSWALSDEETQKLLLKVFPKLHKDKRQRARAGRWMRIISLYYRMEMPLNHVAKELHMNIGTLRFTIDLIRKRAATNTPEHPLEGAFEG